MSLATKAARIIKYDTTRREKDLLTNSVCMNEYGGGDVLRRQPQKPHVGRLPENQNCFLNEAVIS